ncbi:MAG: hypothetical protein PHX78_10120 [bacterium]|nr:hypothetical protein [bacterium]
MKGMLQVPGARDVKSIHSAGLRAIPKIQRSSYLELYTFKREKDRLEKEIFALDKRRNTASRMLNGLYQRIETLEKEIQEEGKIKTYTNIPAKPVKKMTINY